MRLPEDFVAAARQVDILAVARTYVPNMKRKGKNWWAISPFNPSERTPSFAVSQDKQIFKCFSSGEGGGSIDLIMALDPVAAGNYREAILVAARMLGMDLPEQQEEERGAVYYATEALAHALSVYRAALLENAEAIEYLDSRELTLEAIEEYGLGYCTGTHRFPDTLIPHLIQAGVVGEYKGRKYELFRNRITFPVFGISGNPVGMVGRLPKQQMQDGDRKYINTSGTVLYQKGECLYGLPQARRHIRKKGYALLTEGQLDVVGLWCAGVKHAVAGSGTAFTPAQAALLRRTTDKVVIMNDRDIHRAGEKAMVKTADILLAAGLTVEFALLPMGHDPDSYRREMGAEMGDWIDKNSISWIDYYAGLYKKAGRTDLKERVIRRLCETVSLVPDDISQVAMVATISDKTSTPLPAIWSHVARRKDPPPPPENKIEFLPEYQALLYAVVFPDKAREINDYLAVDMDIDEPRLQMIKRYVFGEGVDREELLRSEAGPIYAAMSLTEIAWDEEAMYSVCDTFRLKYITKMIEAIGVSILSATDESKKEKLLRSRILLTKERMRIQANRQ